jgi:aspartate ammonia-lyase
MIGDIDVPVSAYWGVHTARAVENFPISGVTLAGQPYFVTALATVKQAAAVANRDVGELPATLADAIVAVCEEIRGGALLDQFVVDLIQGGAGTSTNMNVNEVVANRALELLGRPRGAYESLHPLEHVNRGQSTNDVYPTAIKLALDSHIQALLGALATLRAAFADKAVEFARILKIGRTQLQDAVPMTLGQEFAAYAVTIGEDEQRLAEARLLLHELNLGGTAIGTALNAHPDYRDRAVAELRRLTGIETLTSAHDLIEATADVGVFVQLSGVLKRVAVKLSKICSDLRLLSSGPRRLQRDQPAGPSGRLVDHAGQGQPGDPRGGQPDRLRRDRQRRHRHAGRRRGSATAQCLRTDHRPGAVRQPGAPHRGCASADHALRARHHGQR